MAKKSKISTPEWILEGYDSEEEFKKAKGKKEDKKKTGKKYNIKVCPECGSDEIKVVVGEETVGEWQCNSCKWRGKEPEKKELTEDEFLEYLDKKDNS